MESEERFRFHTVRLLLFHFKSYIIRLSIPLRGRNPKPSETKGKKKTKHRHRIQTLFAALAALLAAAVLLSGCGGAFNEEMRLVGTIPGGSFSPNGQTFRFGVMIPVSELRLCIEAWKQTQQPPD